MIKQHMYVIAVRDLHEAASYYRDVLGFSIKEIGDDGWRLFERDGCRIMAGHCPDSIPARELGDHSYFAYIVVDDAEVGLISPDGFNFFWFTWSMVDGRVEKQASALEASVRADSAPASEEES